MGSDCFKGRGVLSGVRTVLRNQTVTMGHDTVNGLNATELYTFK